MLITGGNQGLGLAICQHFKGSSVSRSTGHDLRNNINDLVQASLDHDIFINNAYDGVYGEINGDFCQTKLLNQLATTWKQCDKSGYIINIGGVASVSEIPPVLDHDLYAANKAVLRYHSHQWSRAFKQNHVRFRTTLLNVDQLAKPTSRALAEPTDLGHSLTDIIDMITLCLAMQSNTCIEEITAWVNLDHKQ
jgi:NAD(P)-dependent dehydrogenase (short-subunit alcohol dehydrogenase family)